MPSRRRAHPSFTTNGPTMRTLALLAGIVWALLVGYVFLYGTPL
jgi:hypothetical protein